MYKIYINDRPLYLLKTDELNGLEIDGDKILISRYLGKSKFLLNHIDLLEKTQRQDAIVIYSDDKEKLIDDYQNLYKILPAAGGMVYNGDKVLMIFRRGSWDMAKGKIDKGETIEQAAVREVQEETGIKKVKLGRKIHETLHTYKNKKGKRIIKKTYWFRMDTKECNLTPQAEEDIEQAVWLDPVKFLKTEKNVYPNIRDVMEKGI